MTEILIRMTEKQYDSLNEMSLIELHSIIRNGISLPKGHGRLIDADALIEFLNNVGVCANCDYADLCNEHEYDCSLSDRCSEVFAEIVDKQPTIEERKGKWIAEGYYADFTNALAFHCSLCGGHIIDYVCQVYDENPHCKWCGADMVEEGAD